MIGSIKNRRIDRRGTSSSRGTTSAADLPLDHRLTFEHDQDERWTYERDGHIYVNELDIEELIDSDRSDVQFLCGASRCLQNYQLYVWSKGGKDKADFNARVNSLQDKIHGILTNTYDNLTQGLSCEVEEDELWINNISVQKTIQLFYKRPTEKLRRYLFSIRDKLQLILESRRNSRKYDAVRREAQELYSDVTAALECVPVDGPLRLGAGNRDG